MQGLVHLYIYLPRGVAQHLNSICCCCLSSRSSLSCMLNPGMRPLVLVHAFSRRPTEPNSAVEEVEWLLVRH